LKRIVICSDGTWNKPDQSQKESKHKGIEDCLKESWIREASNVVKLTRAILPKDSNGIHQVVYYDPGIGTDTGPFYHIVGGVLGVGLSKNVLDCYRFIANNFSEGDELYLFGFSRGAYTVRSLAGLIQRCGILPKKNIYWANEAYEIYRLRYFESFDDVDSFLFQLLSEKLKRKIFEKKYKRITEKNKECVQRFNEFNNTLKIEIRLIGVWDTVGSLGIPGWRGMRKKYRFHNVKLGDNIVNAYQALAIDEIRKPFKATLWRKKAYPEQKLDQMWFVGSHTNVGGGNKPDGLANCAFHWMVNAAELNGEGLEFDEKYINKLEPHADSKIKNSMTWYYRLLGLYDRPIGEFQDSCESIHTSVHRRMQILNNKEKIYSPANLMKYIKNK